MEKKSIKFPSKNKSGFIQELRNEVSNYFKINKLSKYGGVRLLLKSVFMLSLFVVPYLLMFIYTITSFKILVLCWITIGIGSAGVGMGIMHDAIHRSFSKYPSINKWMGKTLYLLGGFPPNWKHQHNTLHHGFTNIEGMDEDINPLTLIRLSPHKPLKKIHKFQHIYAWFLYGLMTLTWVTDKEFRQLLRYKKHKVALSDKKSYNQLLIHLILAKLIYYCVFILVPIILLPVSWYLVIVLFLIMHFTSGFTLTIIFQTAHVVPDSEYPLPDQNGNMENSWAIHQMLTTSDFSHNNKILSWLIGGLNYQVEHHLFPNISHVHYPQISKIVAIAAKKHDVKYNVQPGFLKALIEHGKMLKKLGTNKNFL